MERNSNMVFFVLYSKLLKGGAKGWKELEGAERKGKISGGERIN